MSTIILPNLLLVIGVVAALAAVCRIPYRLAAWERLDEHLATPELPVRREPERRAA
jgi:hypothetical protein